jgi:hypothetical protein
VLPSSLEIELREAEENGQDSGSHTRLEIRFFDANGNYVQSDNAVNRDAGDGWEELENLTGNSQSHYVQRTTNAHNIPAAAVEYEIRAEVEVKNGHHWYEDQRDRRYLDDIKMVGQC